MKHLLGSFFEIFRLRVRYLGECLRITIHQREPRALYLDHNAVPTAERMVHIRHGEIEFGCLSRLQGLRLLPAIAEFRPHRLSANKLLVASHADRWRPEQPL